MWISAQTPLDDRQPQLLHLDDNPSCALIPGSFGFLQPPEGCTAAFFDLLQGYNLTHQDMATACVEAGDTLYAQTGERVGHWDRALDQDQGRGRLERGTTGEWAADIFTDFQKDNPRILLIPMVTYIEGTGSGAVFQIERFAAFWLEGVNQGQKEVWGRFIQYGSPGGDPNYANVNWALVFNIDLVK